MAASFKQNWVPRNIADIDDANARTDLGQPHFIKREHLSKLYKNYQPKANDTYVATYPKCGTTWTIKIIEHLNKQVLDGIGGGLTEDEFVPWFETITSPKFRVDVKKAMDKVNAKENRVWKTHSTPGLLPKPETGKIKVIVCTRHPLDVFVSTWHHVRRMSKSTEYEEPFTSFFRNVCLTGLNTDHILRFHEEYFEAVDKGEIEGLFIKFEDMKTENGAMDGIEKIAKFMNISEFDADKIAKLTSFKSMRKLESDKGMLTAKKGENGEQVFQKGTDTSAGTVDKVGTNHIRAGKVGGWVEYMNDEDLVMWRNYVRVWEVYCPLTVEFYGRDFLMGG